MQNEALVKEINTYMAVALSDRVSMEDLLLAFIQHINFLIQKDFQKLIFLLYRADVSEKKLTQLLQQNHGKDAANIIASLIIERELQKIESRKQFKQNPADIDEEERW